MIETSTPIAPGATPFLYPGGSVGVLIIHGYGGSIGDYHDFAKLLSSSGLTVSGMRVAGHGQGIKVLAKSDIYDWRESVFMAARELLKRCPRIFLVGASFGGDLAIDYAVHAGSAVSGIITINTPLTYSRAGIKKFGLNLLRVVASDLPKFGLAQTEKKRYLELGSTTAWPIDGLIATQNYINIFVKPALSRLIQPILVMKNSSDPYVSNRSATEIYNLIPHPNKKMVTIPGQTHRPFRDSASVQFMAEQVQEFIQRTIAKT